MNLEGTCGFQIDLPEDVQVDTFDVSNHTISAPGGIAEATPIFSDVKP